LASHWGGGFTDLGWLRNGLYGAKRILTAGLLVNSRRQPSARKSWPGRDRPACRHCSWDFILELVVRREFQPSCLPHFAVRFLFLEQSQRRITLRNFGPGTKMFP